MQIIYNFSIGNASYRKIYHGKCKSLPYINWKMQFIGKFSVENASYRKIYYGKFKSLPYLNSKMQSIGKFLCRKSKSSTTLP